MSFWLLDIWSVFQNKITRGMLAMVEISIDNLDIHGTIHGNHLEKEEAMIMIVDFSNYYISF